jgi:DNA helicase IV
MKFHELIPEIPAELTKAEKLEFSKKYFLDEKIYCENLNKLWNKLNADCDSNEDIFFTADMLHEHFGPRNFNHVLIDEAQDWYTKEKDILFAIFKPENFVISYGSYQMLRKKLSNNCDKNDPDDCDWSTFNDKKISEIQFDDLQLNYRQKNNVCLFVSDLLQRLDFPKKIKANKELLGGNINISRSIDFDIKKYELINEYTVTTCKNASFDNLILVGPDENDQSIVNKLVHSDRLFFDGTKKSKEFQSDFDAARIYHYESCRGLEGWCVIAYNLDLFLLKKTNLIVNPKEGLSLQETKREGINQWLYIILTRAIDSLYITLYDVNSPISKEIIETAQNHHDFCTIEI